MRFKLIEVDFVGDLNVSTFWWLQIAIRSAAQITFIKGALLPIFRASNHQNKYTL